jgi:transcriptional regulator with XRE-family HTH domain
MLAADMAGRPPKTPAPPFGRRISTLRKDRGLSQEQFAKLLGTTRGMVEYYERRARNPSLEVVQQVAQVLGVTVAELVGEEAQKKARPRPGPVSKLEERFEEIRQLPRRQQAFILKMLDVALTTTRDSD